MGVPTILLSFSSLRVPYSVFWCRGTTSTSVSNFYWLNVWPKHPPRIMLTSCCISSVHQLIYRTPERSIMNPTSTTQSYLFAHCKTINCRHSGRGCLKKWCIPLDLLRLPWLANALLFLRQELTWRAPATTVVCRHDGNEFLLIGVNGKDCCPQYPHRSRK